MLLTDAECSAQDECCHNCRLVTREANKGMISPLPAPPPTMLLFIRSPFISAGLLRRFPPCYVGSLPKYLSYIIIFQFGLVVLITPPSVCLRIASLPHREERLRPTGVLRRLLCAVPSRLYRCCGHTLCG